MIRFHQFCVLITVQLIIALPVLCQYPEVDDVLPGKLAIEKRKIDNLNWDLPLRSNFMPDHSRWREHQLPGRFFGQKARKTFNAEKAEDGTNEVVPFDEVGALSIWGSVRSVELEDEKTPSGASDFFRHLKNQSIEVPKNSDNLALRYINFLRRITNDPTEEIELLRQSQNSRKELMKRFENYVEKNQLAGHPLVPKFIDSYPEDLMNLLSTLMEERRTTIRNVGVSGTRRVRDLQKRQEGCKPGIPRWWPTTCCTITYCPSTCCPNKFPCCPYTCCPMPRPWATSCWPVHRASSTTPTSAIANSISTHSTT